MDGVIDLGQLGKEPRGSIEAEEGLAAIVAASSYYLVMEVNPWTSLHVDVLDHGADGEHEKDPVTVHVPLIETLQMDVPGFGFVLAFAHREEAEEYVRENCPNGAEIVTVASTRFQRAS